MSTSASGALIGGTFAFVAFSIVTAFGIFMIMKMKRLTKDEAQIACISNVVAWFCMWLMWICTWLHQWHPVIKPIRPDAMLHLDSHSPEAGGGGGGHH